jgi:hypothetical protein
MMLSNPTNTVNYLGFGPPAVASAGVWRKVIPGVLLCLIGGVWIGQGVGVIGGSFMTGQGIWAVIGAGALLGGLVMLRRAAPRRR